MLRLHSSPKARSASRRRASSCSRTATRAPAGRTCPEFIRALPANVWTHTTGPHPARDAQRQSRRRHRRGLVRVRRGGGRARGRRGRSAIFSRRAYIDYPGDPPRHGPAGRRLTADYAGTCSSSRTSCPRWCAGATTCSAIAASRRCRSIRSQRAVAFKGFHIHLNTSLVRRDDGRATARSRRRRAARPMRFDHLIAATGYRIDLSAQPELARIHEHDRAVARPLQAGGRRGERGGGPASVSRCGLRVPAARRARARSTCATSTASTSRRS